MLNCRNSLLWMAVCNCINFTILFSGDFHPEVNIDERIRRLQNDFGVDVLFTWGIIEQEGKNLSKIFLIELDIKWWNHALIHPVKIVILLKVR